MIDPYGSHRRPCTPRLVAPLVLATAPWATACESPEPARGTPAPPAATAPPAVSGPLAPGSIHALTMRQIDGKETSLGAFAGKVLLVVNTASKCGYTPQYEGLQALHEKYASRGFAVLGFPSDDFGGQEPGTSEEIATFCKVRFGVTFPLFQKVKTKGADRAPLFALLERVGEPEWNFHKFLVDKHGIPVQAWPSATAPDDREIADAIEVQLTAP